MKTQRKSIREIRDLFQNLVVTSIYGEPYDKDLKTREEKVKFLYDCFLSEYGYNIPRVGFHNALRDYFQGLPTICTVPFYNFDIIQLAIDWGILDVDHTERQADKIIESYWDSLANKTRQLFNSYKLNTINPYKD